MITLYDIPSNLPEKAFSPNTFKVRIALNYKRIPYKTEWVELPDIESLVKKLGGLPTSKKPDGRDHYTLPAILDSTTGRVVTESEVIVTYLDETYPDTPRVFPSFPKGNTRAAIAVFEHIFMMSIRPIIPRLLAPACSVLKPRSEVYARKTREAIYGKLEDIAPPGPIREGMWKEVKEALDSLAGFYEKNGEGKLFLFGDTFSFADAIVIGYLAWIQMILGKESEEWKALAGWSYGRWGKLVESTKDLCNAEN